jgi:hypothetical protein
MTKRLFPLMLIALLALPLSGCWYAAAARGAEKRTTQTGPVMGTLEQSLDVEDPLGRDQQTLD